MLADEGTFYELIVEHVRDHAKRHALERRAMQRFNEVMSDVEELRRAMEVVFSGWSE